MARIERNTYVGSRSIVKKKIDGWASMPQIIRNPITIVAIKERYTNLWSQKLCEGHWREMLIFW